MSKGLANFTVPTADDIALGESKVYGNYGLPTQIEIGALRGGLKTSIARDIKEIEFDGAYGPVKGLRRTKIMVGKFILQNLVLKYTNKKKISDCESGGLWENSNWGGDGGTYSAETTIVNSGLQSAKCAIATTQTGHGIHEVFASSKDLTVFGNSVVSDTGDFIGFAVYITTAMKAILGTDSIRIIFHMDIEGTETNYYYYDVESTALTADKWTTFNIAKSSFTEVGTGDWSAVTGISFEVPDETDDALEFYVDSIDLIENQSSGTLFPLKGNGGEFSYTDEGDYRKFVGNLSIADDDYYENIAVVEMKHSGKPYITILERCYNDGNINLALNEKDESVNSTEFTGHYEGTTPTVVPIEIRDYDVDVAV